jgi:anti-anti-sigma regulatory factor
MPSPKQRAYLQRDTHDRVTVVRFLAREFVDEAVIDAVGRQLLQVVEEMKQGDLLLNCSRLWPVSSLFIGKLLQVSRAVWAREGRFTLCSLSNEFGHLCDSLGLRGRYAFYDSEPIALADLQGSPGAGLPPLPEIRIVHDLEVRLEHWPGELARVTRALTESRVTIQSLAVMAIEQHASLRIIPSDVEVARKALDAKRIPFQERTLFSISTGQGGEHLPSLASRLAQARISIEAVYMIGQQGKLLQLALAVDDVERAKEILGVRKL